MSLISVYIIAFNEAEKVAATIESAKWADEVVLVDSWSTDGTPEIAAKLGAKVVQVDFKGFGDLRNQAIAACTHEWIFSLDADERCTPQAEQEIRGIMADSKAVDVYWMPRRNFFMGRWIKHSGWYPNYRQPQLFPQRQHGLRPETGARGLHPAQQQTHRPFAPCDLAVPFKNMAEKSFTKPIDTQHWAHNALQNPIFQWGLRSRMGFGLCQTLCVQTWIPGRMGRFRDAWATSKARSIVTSSHRNPEGRGMERAPVIHLRILDPLGHGMLPGGLLKIDLLGACGWD
jgi:hypothetical protein